MMPMSAVVPERPLVRGSQKIAWRIWPMWRLWYPLRYRILHEAEILHGKWRWLLH